MKGWLSDMVQTVWALLYWNARKTVYRARRGQGTCPCHNPSDSGKPMETGCEAVTGWSRPARFQKVCPLLKQNPKGAWVCSVSPAEVRPFWGRVGIYFGTTGLVLWIGLVGTAFWGMHLIGYQVTLRQLAWPPAWRELRGVRADLFIDQARNNYRAGRVQEAIRALSIAHELNPRHYPVAMMLAQFNQAGNALQSDLLYSQLMQTHPERRSEIARTWFQSLLARGRMTDIAELAKRQLLAEPEQAPAWTFALLFAARHQPNNDMLMAMAADQTLPTAPREVLKLAAQMSKLTPPQARQVLLETPVVAGFSYDLVFRIDELIRWGYAPDALAVLAKVRSALSGRDVARLLFAAYAVQPNRDRLLQEFRALLSPKRSLRAAECTLLAVHLIKYPDPALLSMLVEGTKRLPVEPADAWMESALAVFCAAGVQGDVTQMHAIKQMITDTYAISPLGLAGMELFFIGKSEQSRIETFLPNLNPLSLELNYALLDRYYQVPPAQ